MKVRIKTFNGEFPEYLTEGKVYEAQGRLAKSEDNMYFSILADDGVEINTRLNNCIMWLGGGSWEIIND